jgi:hypothetical protein
MIPDNHFTQQYNPEDSSEHHTRRRENLKSHRHSAVLREQMLHEIRARLEHLLKLTSMAV